MKNRKGQLIALMLFSVILAGLVQAQPMPNRVYGDSLGEDRALAIVQARDSGYVLGGSSRLAGQTATVFKTNKYGALQWVKRWINKGTSEVTSLLRTPDGGFAMTGYYKAPLQGSKRRIFIMRLDPNGNHLWGWLVGGAAQAADEIAYSITQTKDGGFAILGKTGNWGPAPQPNIVLYRFDSLGFNKGGRVYWRTAHKGFDEGLSIVTLPNGNTKADYAICGRFQANDTVQFPRDKSDAYVAFLDANFSPFATFRVAGQVEEEAWSVCPDGVDSVAFTGWTTSYGPGPYGTGNSNIFFARGLSPNMSGSAGRTWGFAPDSLYPGSGDEKVQDDRSLMRVAGQDRGFVITGFTKTRGFGLPKYNSLILKLDPTGGLAWARVHPSIVNNNHDDQFSAVARTVYNTYAVAGRTTSFLSKPLGTFGSAELFTIDMNGNRPQGKCIIPVDVPYQGFDYGRDSLSMQSIDASVVAIKWEKFWMPSKALCRPTIILDTAIGLPNLPTLKSGDTLRPGTFTPAVRVGSYGVYGESIRVNYHLTGPGDQTWLDSGIAVRGTDEEEVTYQFSPITVSQVGAYSYTAWVPPCDFDPTDDTLHIEFVIAAGNSGSRWSKVASIPAGPRNKGIKDGGAMTYDDVTGLIYAFKGNNTNEFYAYNPVSNTWNTLESIPQMNRLGKKKRVKKGAALVATKGRIYALKGASTLDLWQYTPGDQGGVWVQKADLPLGVKTVKEGAGLAAVWDDTDIAHVYILKGSNTDEFYRYDWDMNGDGQFTALAPAPLGVSGRYWKKGSCLTAEDDWETPVVYALKGGYNEFFAYDIGTNTWMSKASLPLIGSSGRKKKAGDGASITSEDDWEAPNAIYALKGNNTREFWCYSAATNAWTQLEDIPTIKGVKGGGSLAWAGGLGYAFGAAATYESYCYTPHQSNGLPVLVEPGAQAGAVVPVNRYGLTIAPNPAIGPATVAFALPVAGNVTLKLYDVTGKAVATLAEGYCAAGSHVLPVGGARLARGIYLVRLITGGTATTQKLVIE